MRVDRRAWVRDGLGGIGLVIGAAGAVTAVALALAVTISLVAS